MSKVFETGEFIKIGDATYVEQGINEGDLLYLAGDAYVPETEDDPYLFRKAFVCARLVDGHIQAEERPTLMTAQSFTPLTLEELDECQSKYEKDFGAANDAE